MWLMQIILLRIAIERGSEGFDEVIARFGEKILTQW